MPAARNQNIDALLVSHKIPIEEEIKWSLPRNSKIKKLKGEIRESFYKSLFTTLRFLDAECVVVIWDEGRTTLKGDAAIEKLIDYTFERISVHLTKQKDHALLVADRPSGGQKEIDKFIKHFESRYHDGTEHVSGNTCAHNIFTTPSKLCRGLQLVDVLVSVTGSMVAGNHQYASPIFDEFKPLFIENYLGRIGGTGLKLFPDSLINLYYWLLGEIDYTKVRYMTGKVLPMKTSDYNTNPY